MSLRTCCRHCSIELERIRFKHDVVFASTDRREATKTACEEASDNPQQTNRPGTTIARNANAILFGAFRLLYQKFFGPDLDMWAAIRLDAQCSHRSPERVCVSCIMETLTYTFCGRLNPNEEEKKDYFWALSRTLRSLSITFRLIGYIGRDRILYNTLNNISCGIKCSNTAARWRLRSELHTYRILHTTPQVPTVHIPATNCTNIAYMLDEEDVC